MMKNAIDKGASGIAWCWMNNLVMKKQAFAASVNSQNTNYNSQT